MDYVVCFYFGDRRGIPPLDDKYKYLKLQTEYVKRNRKEINKAVFVINGLLTDEQLLNVEDIVKEEAVILNRENLGGSYAAWSFGIEHILSDCSDYIFVCEDDYLPKDKAISIFLERFEEETAFVCQLLSTTQPIHAAISNGVFRTESLRKVKEQRSDMFDLINSNRYADHERNQCYFLNFIGIEKVKDLSDYKHLFNSIGKIKVHGDELAEEVIEPIL